ncbi:glycosyltransferase [Streptomyces sp. NPDC051132]|uniref:glycosyltransferase n=1 Tax=unclassified Streptomyces TaxID=2593676 RepID=UPI003444FEBC
MQEETVPRLSVVIPTYNREGLLDRTLASLVRQDLPASDFEVVVADDGSSDGTAALVRSYADRLRVRYHFQEDLGFRVAAARNGGARLATAPVLAFLDTGMIVGPDWVRAHLDVHAAGRRQAVLGYSYGYNPANPCREMDGIVDTLPPEEVVRRLIDVPSFQDMRLPDYERFGFDPGRMAMPWVFLWTLNFSVPADEFWAVGGFDEDFTGWGVEDIELGYRLHRNGNAMVVSRAAWGIELPHERAYDAATVSILRNCQRFLDKHPGVQTELYWAASARAVSAGGLVDPLEVEWEDLLAWTAAAEGRDAAGELAESTRDLTGRDGDPLRVAVFGCGAQLPAEWAHANARFTLCDFDAEALRQAVAGAPATVVESVQLCGMRTPWADRQFDLVVITSRLAGGLWSRWGDHVLAEAKRLGGEVRAPAPEHM